MCRQVTLRACLISHLYACRAHPMRDSGCDLAIVNGRRGGTINRFAFFLLIVRGGFRNIPANTNQADEAGRATTPPQNAIFSLRFRTFLPSRKQKAKTNELDEG